MVSRFRSHYQKCPPESSISHLYFFPTALYNLCTKEIEVFHRLMGLLVTKEQDTNRLLNKIIFLNAYQQYKQYYPHGFDIATLKAFRAAKVSQATLVTLPQNEQIAKEVKAYQLRYQQFTRLPNTTQIFDVLNRYVHTILGEQASSLAGTHWLCEYLPKAPVEAEIIYCRFYLGNFNILTASTWQGNPRYTLYLNLPDFEEAYRRSSALLPKNPDKLQVTKYKLDNPFPDGETKLYIKDTAIIIKLLEDEAFVTALKRSNEILLQKRLKATKITHNADFARLLFT